jgi:hypothetical protein
MAKDIIFKPLGVGPRFALSGDDRRRNPGVGGRLLAQVRVAAKKPAPMAPIYLFSCLAICATNLLGVTLTDKTPSLLTNPGITTRCPLFSPS